MHYHVYKSSPLVPILNHFKQFHNLPLFYFPKIHFNIILTCMLGLLSHLFLLPFQSKILYAFLIFPMHATCPTHLILHNLITLIIFHETPHYAVFPRLLSLLPLWGTNVLLSTLFSNTLNLHSSLSVRDHVPHPNKITGKIIERRWEDSELNESKHFPNSVSFCMDIIFICYCHSHVFELHHIFKGFTSHQ